MTSVPGIGAELLERRSRANRQEGGFAEERPVQLGVLRFEKSAGHPSGDAELTAGCMCLEFGAVFTPVKTAMD